MSLHTQKFEIPATMMQQIVACASSLEHLRTLKTVFEF